MGTRWGISGTVAQIRSPAVLSERAESRGDRRHPLVARSNVSTSLKELQGWDLVKVAHVMGDRRDRTDQPCSEFRMNVVESDVPSSSMPSRELIERVFP
jgi:DNA-binding transcriptional regulator GbsR (MarR family)